MGRLAGFSYRDVARKLKKLGFEFYHTGKGDHEIWLNPNNRLRTTVPHHREIKEGTLRNILKQAQLVLSIDSLEIIYLVNLQIAKANLFTIKMQTMNISYRYTHNLHFMER